MKVYQMPSDYTKRRQSLSNSMKSSDPGLCGEPVSRVGLTSDPAGLCSEAQALRAGSIR